VIALKIETCILKMQAQEYLIAPKWSCILIVKELKFYQEIQLASHVSREWLNTIFTWLFFWN
jgi:hypothetical protein